MESYSTTVLSKILESDRLLAPLGGWPCPVAFEGNKEGSAPIGVVKLLGC